jgi:hypothetical protein
MTIHLIIMVVIIIIIEKILVPLRDSDWHKLEEINKEIPVLTHHLEEITLFLREQSFINKENLK